MPNPNIAALVGKSLDAVTTTGPGSALVFEAPRSEFSIQAFTTGNPTNVLIYLEFSIDGINYISPGNLGIQFTTGQGSTSVSGMLYISVRANLITLSGGASPTVTAWIAAA